MTSTRPFKHLHSWDKIEDGDNTPSSINMLTPGYAGVLSLVRTRSMTLSHLNNVSLPDSLPFRKCCHYRAATKTRIWDRLSIVWMPYGIHSSYARGQDSTCLLGHHSSIPISQHTCAVLTLQSTAVMIYMGKWAMPQIRYLILSISRVGNCRYRTTLARVLGLWIPLAANRISKIHLTSYAPHDAPWCDLEVPNLVGCLRLSSNDSAIHDAKSHYKDLNLYIAFQ